MLFSYHGPSFRKHCYTKANTAYETTVNKAFVVSQNHDGLIKTIYYNELLFKSIIHRLHLKYLVYFNNNAMVNILN